jgi:hypothetical protein
MTGEYPMPFFILGIVIDCNGNICNNILEFTVTTHITAAGKHAKHVDDGNGSHRQVRLRDLIKYAKARAIAEQLDVKATNINNCLLGLTMENEIVLREAIAVTGSGFIGTVNIDFVESPLMNPAVFSQFLVLIFSNPFLPARVNRIPYISEAKRLALATFGHSLKPIPFFQTLTSSR